MLYYDAWIPNLQNFTEMLLANLDLTNLQLQAGWIEFNCAEIEQRCVGSNTQYTSAANCVSVLSQKPFGDYDEAWGDNVVCRAIHTILTKIDPDVSEDSCVISHYYVQLLICYLDPLPSCRAVGRREVHRHQLRRRLLQRYSSLRIASAGYLYVPCARSLVPVIVAITEQYKEIARDVQGTLINTSRLLMFTLGFSGSFFRFLE